MTYAEGYKLGYKHGLESQVTSWLPIEGAKGKCIFKVHVKNVGFHVVSGYASSDGKLTNDVYVDLAGDAVAFIPYPMESD